MDIKDYEIYLTDKPETLKGTLENRRKFYKPELKQNWADADAQFIRTSKDEEILLINGLEVMREFEKPYMISIADTATQAGGVVLNVGYGIGIIDTHIEQFGRSRGMKAHHIIELNKQAFERASIWRKSSEHADTIFLHQGDWKDVLYRLKAQGIQFDGVAYDAFPLEEQDLHRDFIPFFELLMRLKLVKEKTGIITFYLDSKDGLGKNFIEYTKRLGVRSTAIKKINVELPPNQYWEAPCFFTPTLTNITYRTEPLL
jgi:hypothetical protein